MKKEFMIITMLLGLTILISCNKTKVEKTIAKSPTSFSKKVYEPTDGYSNEIYFIDSSFCVVGFAWGDYEFSEKTNELTMKMDSLIGSETTLLIYNAENDTLTSNDGTAWKYSRLCTEEEINTAKELKQALSE